MAFYNATNIGGKKKYAFLFIRFDAYRRLTKTPSYSPFSNQNFISFEGYYYQHTFPLSVCKFYQDRPVYVIIVILYYIAQIFYDLMKKTRSFKKMC